MIKILFVCHGNVCRSPMAEFVMKHYVDKNGLSGNFYIQSAATSYEEIGNPVHYGTAKILDRLNVDYSDKRAVKLLKTDYDKFDYIIGMDERNIVAMNGIFGGDPEKKIFKILDFTSSARDVADPWYTGDFEKTYSDITVGVEGLLKKLLKN